MILASRTRFALTAALALSIAFGPGARAQQAHYPKQTDLPDPYQLVENWPTLPKSMNGGHWGELIRADIDPQGNIWVAYDTYKSGNYDVYLTKVTNNTPTPEIPIATTPNMEARPTLTTDTTGRLWIAWEEGGANWGKDNGYWFRTRNLGIPLGAQRRIQIRAQVIFSIRPCIHGNQVVKVTPRSAMARVVDPH